MGNFLIGLSIPIIVGIVIASIILWRGKKKEAVKATEKKPDDKKSEKGHEEHKDDKSKDEHGGHDDHHGHDKPKKTIGQKIKSLLWNIILFAITITISIWTINFVVEMFNKLTKVPIYETTLIEIDRKTINLDTEFNIENYIQLKYGQKCTFENATVPFCVRNSVGKLAYGKVGSKDVNLTPGPENQDLWFKSNSKHNGTIEVLIFDRRTRQIN